MVIWRTVARDNLNTKNSKTMSEKDTLFSEPTDAQPGSFEFNEPVVRVFSDMIERSVPGYRQLLELTPLIVRSAVTPNSRVYDLGCSLGAATLAARRAIQVPGVEMIGLDNSPEMVARCQHIIAQDNSTVPVEIQVADITEQHYQNASLCLMYFTLQFVSVDQRSGLLERIYEGLNPGGVLLLAEKLRFESADEQAWMDEHHLSFKRSQGYSDLEIAKKRQAIENVLIPQSAKEHEAALKQAGFGHIHRWFQCLNFSCFVAIK